MILMKAFVTLFDVDDRKKKRGALSPYLSGYSSAIIAGIASARRDFVALSLHVPVSKPLSPTNIVSQLARWAKH